MRVSYKNCVAMDIFRIAALLEPFVPCPLSESQLTQISMYIDLLIRWNARINLTAIRDPEEIVTRHFGESLFSLVTSSRSIKMRRPVNSKVEKISPSGCSILGLALDFRHSLLKFGLPTFS